MFNVKTIFFLIPIIITSVVCVSCNPKLKNKVPLDKGLIGNWKLKEDLLDHSGNNLHTKLHILNGLNKNTSIVDFKESKSWLEVPASPKLQLADRDFSIAVWVDALDTDSDIGGDILSQYDLSKRKGFHLSLKTNPSPTGVANYRQLSFGVDDNISTKWEDCGRPGNALLAFGLTEYRGTLFAGTCEPESGGAGHVYRYDSVSKNWLDCGTPDQSNTVFALTEYEGELYAATGKYRVAGSSLPESENVTLGGTVFRFEEPNKWINCGKLPGVEAIVSLVVYKGDLYASSLYSPGFFKYNKKNSIWENCVTPYGKRVISFGIFNGYLFATSYDLGHVYRYDRKDWIDCGNVGEINTQTYGFAVYQGQLYVSTWPSGRVYVYEGINNWKDVGRLGDELEVMGLIVHNGQLLGGTLPLAETYIYESDTTWRRMNQLDETKNVKYKRAWTMAEHSGKVYCSTLPSGHIYSYEAGKSVSWGKSFPDGWHHVVALKSANFLELYVDGRLVDKTQIPDSLRINLGSSEPMKIGFGQNNIFNGKIEDVRLYDRVLNEDEIKLLANKKGH